MRDQNMDLQKQPPEVFSKKKSVPKIFLSFTGKHLCWSLFLDPRPWLDGCYEFGPFRLSVRKVSLDWPINFS